MNQVEQAWWHFESSDQYAKLIKQCRSHKIDIDKIILEFLKSIGGDLGKQLAYDHQTILYWDDSNVDTKAYYDAIECVTEDLIDKELL